ncbi:serine hydrolase [Conexibacter stalactiti]|uniref:Serine hydrolase n=1 Tax=Conexibacter stalactiti TaxID=1940611 RepID=A0ABU4HVQ2_9ACTN|nr:serine hydrolase [Conexibacter stalactiti]MDW5597411.1 serine hydrolase [Conexibacter stalactiti]MEC5038053.1 serine hydrolase [Conexibacter stalactiti]
MSGADAARADATAAGAEAEAALARAFAAAGVSGWLHAVDLDGGAEIGIEPDAPVVAASVFKLPVLVELCRQASAGTVALTQRVQLPAGSTPTDGGIGLSVMLDDVELSLRDLALLMMSISDNRATDVIMELLGLDAINATMRDHGFPGTVLLGDCACLFETMEQDLGMPYDDIAPEQYEARFAAIRAMRAVTATETNRTTPRETTRLLAALWRDELLDAAGSAEARRILGLQVWPHRLSAGFPDDRVRISAKTGTIAHLRSEAGVVEHPDGGRCAVAVFVASTTPAVRNPAADRAIGEAARIAVDHLRSIRGCS